MDTRPCSTCRRLVAVPYGSDNKVLCPNCFATLRTRSVALEHVVREHGPKAGSCALYGVKLTDMTRDELLAVAAMLGEKAANAGAFGTMYPVIAAPGSSPAG